MRVCSPVFAAVFATLTVGSCAAPFGARPLLRHLPDGTPHTTVIVDVDVFTGREGEPLLRRQDVRISGARVTSVVPTGAPLGDATDVVKGRGLTLLPGFVDAHVHLGLMGDPPWGPVKPDREHALHAHLYAGVTTVFDLGGESAKTKGLRADVVSGRTLGPRIFLTETPFTGPGSHPVPLAKDLVGFPLSLLVSSIVEQASTPDEARVLVASRVANQLDYVKITFDDMPPGTPKMSEEVLRASIDATHAANLKAVVHTTAAADLVLAAEAGADLLAHGPYRDLVTPAMARQIAASGAAIVPTLAGFDALADATTGEFHPHPMIRETTPRSLLDSVEGDVGKRLHDYPAMRGLGEASVQGRTTWAASIKNLVDAGVTLLVGTDSALPGTYPGGSYHHELALLAELGVPTDLLLLGATSRAAKWVDDEPDFGTVEAGKAADLVLVRGNPLEELAALHAIESVWVGGRLLDRLPPSP